MEPELIYNYDCRHAACQGYGECLLVTEQRDRDELYRRLRSGESLCDLGTNPLTALNGDLISQ